MKKKIILTDLNGEMIKAWRTHLGKFEFEYFDVEIGSGDFLNIKADAFVVPGNSFGVIDGGASLAAKQRFPNLEVDIKKDIETKHKGELLVGFATSTTAGDSQSVIYAPTIRKIGDVGQERASYLAMRGAILHWRYKMGADQPLWHSIDTISVPGLGTGAGKYKIYRAAHNMFNAIKTVEIHLGV